MQQVVAALWLRLDEVQELRGKHVWKPLSGWLPRPTELTSRLWRCVLEGAGRTLRAQADRNIIMGGGAMFIL